MKVDHHKLTTLNRPHQVSWCCRFTRRGCSLNREIGTALPNNQRYHGTLQIQKDVLTYGLSTDCATYVLVTVPRVSRSCEHFPDGFDLHLLHSLNIKGASDLFPVAPQVDIKDFPAPPARGVLRSTVERLWHT